MRRYFESSEDGKILYRNKFVQFKCTGPEHTSESSGFSMKTMEGIGASRHPVVMRFTKYLNGPMGKTVLENLDEGESFVLQTSEHTLRVTKRRGKAVVGLMQTGPERKKPPDWTIKAR